MKGTFFFFLSKSRLGSYRPHDPIEGYLNPDNVLHVVLGQKGCRVA